MSVRYITVEAETKLFKPATRSYGDIAIIGNVANTANGPSLTPIPVTNPNSVMHSSNAAGNNLPITDDAWFNGDLGTAVETAFKQTPGPSKVYAVRADLGNEDHLSDAFSEVSKLNAQLVVLANTSLTSNGTTGRIEALANHVNTVSNSGGDGKERIGVAMLAKEATDPAVITGNMKSDRMVMVAHNSDDDAAAAFAGVIAGYKPHISVLLKPVMIDMPTLFSDSQIDIFEADRINWLTSPAVMPGSGIYAGEAYTLGTDKPYIDIVRTIDDVSFRLKAALIVAIGKLRVTRTGLKDLASRMAAVLEPLVMEDVIEAYDIFIPVLEMLDKDPGNLTDVELQIIANAQNTRTVESTLTVDYAGAIHRLNIKLIFE